MSDLLVAGLRELRWRIFERTEECRRAIRRMLGKPTHIHFPNRAAAFFCAAVILVYGFLVEPGDNAENSPHFIVKINEVAMFGAPSCWDGVELLRPNSGALAHCNAGGLETSPDDGL